MSATGAFSTPAPAIHNPASFSFSLPPAMQGNGYRRPRLCLLCECPVVDGGVKVTQLKLDRLSRWWKAHWDTDFEHKSRTVCHFCVWDLRFADENSKEKEPADQKWWPNSRNTNTNTNHYKYYRDELMKPCFVRLKQLENADKLLHKESGPEHQCLYCHQTYTVYRNLFHHAKRVHPEKFVNCNKRGCGKFFHTEEEKAVHTKKQHRTTGEGCSQKCVYCGKVSASFHSNYNHMQKYHKHQIIRCTSKLCKNYFKTKKERDKHVKDFHNFGKFFCCFCDIYFKSNTSQLSHMKYCHKEALKCNASARGCPNYFKTEEDRQKHIQEKHSKNICVCCGASFVRSGTLTLHMQQVHKGEAIRCDTHLCATWFKTEEERQKHNVEKHESDATKAPCPFCKKFMSISALRTHSRIQHKGEKLIKCSYFNCTTFFKCDEDKKAHIKQVHEIFDEKFCCFYCDKFILKNMYQHVFKLHKDVAIKCNFHNNCPNFFKTLEDRDKHVREVHQVEKIREPIPCPYCDLILAAKNTLAPHIQLKHSEIAIKCQYPQCGDYFKSQEDLEAHFSLKPKHKLPFVRKELRLIKKYKCSFCQKFYSKSDLKEHIIQEKHNQIQEVCPHCKKTTSNSKLHVVSDFCKRCNQKFQCLGLLRSHRWKCIPIRRCPVCQKVFKLECQLTYHCKRNHTVRVLKWRGLQFESKGFKCDDCLQYFESRCALRYHETIRHEESVSTCDFCKKQFSNKLRVKFHISQIHLLRNKCCYCPVCNLRLKNADVLKEHIQNKKCSREYLQCQVCDVLLKRSTFKRHLKEMH